MAPFDISGTLKTKITPKGVLRTKRFTYEYSRKCKFCQVKNPAEAGFFSYTE